MTFGIPAGPANSAGAAAGPPVLDLTPSPGSAPAGQRILAQARGEVGILLRNGEQLLVALVLPALVLVGLSQAHSPDLGSRPRIDVITPGVLALAVLSSAFTGQAIQTGFERRYGVLRLLGITPLGRAGFLGAKGLATAAVVALQLVVLGGLGLALGWHPHATGLPIALVFVVMGAACFAALALLLAGTVRAEGVLAVANLVWVLLLAVGAVVVPAAVLPSGLRGISRALPSGALGEGLRAALLDGHIAVGSFAILLAWGAAAAALVTRTFRWSD